MNLLELKQDLDGVIKTDRATKITIDGVSRTVPIYQVRLDLLYYNDRNDRIATWMSQYNQEHGTDGVDKSDMEAYNNIIHQFITESNPERLKQTERNIKLVGQQKYGVVLRDGRIIDGNRRFTCLRNLAKDDPKFNHFETIILDSDIEKNEKQIKILELNIQIGEDEKVDYDPIDRLVGVYNSIRKKKLITVHEYAMSTGTTEKEVNNLLELSELLVEFLETINAPEQYYIARDLNINGPLHELQGVLRKVDDEQLREDIKFITFTNFLIQPSNDMTRFIRQLRTIAASKYLPEFVESEGSIAEEIIDSLPKKGEMDKSSIQKIRGKERLKEKLKDEMDLYANKAKSSATKDKPNQILRKACDSLNSIDPRIVSKLTKGQKQEMIEHLDDLEIIIEELRKATRKRK